MGIRNGDHRSSILSYLANKDPNGTEHHEQANQRVTLCVEGNISAGKSTVLQALLKGSKELQHVIEVLLLDGLLESTSITERWQSVFCSY